MAATLTYDTVRSERISRNLCILTGKVTFDNSYLAGGESISGISNYFKGTVSGELVVNFEQHQGYNFEWDRTNNKVKVFGPAPPIVWEELVDCSSDLAYLAYPAAYIIYVASANTAHKVIHGSLTPAAGQVAVDMGDTAGVFTRGKRCSLTFPSGEGAASTYITYITQAWKDVVDNIVNAKLTAGARVYGHASLALTASTPDSIDLGEAAIAIQSYTWDDNGTIKDCDALYKGETAATKEVTIDFANATNTTLEVLQTDTQDATTDSIYITYIKKPSSGMLSDNFIEEDDLTPSTDVVTVSSGADLSNMLLFGTCGGLPGPTTKYTDLLRAGATLGTTVTNVNMTTNLFVSNGTYAANTLTLGSDHNDANHLKLSYIWGAIPDIWPVVPLEVPNATDLSHVVPRFMAIGLK
ncbi:hypothetical protein LCGC14_0407200 [marine sediment metagenome]|uniref:Uncharacterized protein n=1 Tax=marine sediment metagenome TaxID=412755 RepID=A0A0F9SV42_9ZZZZ